MDLITDELLNTVTNPKIKKKLQTVKDKPLLEITKVIRELLEILESKYMTALETRQFIKASRYSIWITELKVIDHKLWAR